MGMVLVTTAIFKITWSPTWAERPIPSREPNLSLAFSEMLMPRQTSRANRMIIIKAPISPSSSQTMAKIKSFWGSGR